MRAPLDLKGSLVSDLLAPGIELIETHISWVFLAEREVWKVKKPVSLGFLDFSEPPQRRAACEAEVRLNRRLAAEVYRGVVPITRGRSGRHRFGGDGEPVDWAVHMHRLDETARADRRLADGRLGALEVERIAARLARFHAAARADAETAGYGSVEAIAGNVRENFAQTRDSAAAFLTPAQAAETEAWQLRFLEHNQHLFAERAAAGRVRDGHGDLRLEHVYMSAGGGSGGDGDGEDDGGVVIVDCIEFNRRFRFADVAADVAFLAMDLSWQGRADLAERFLAAYAHRSGDYGLYPLIDFYESYRAWVRGKVAVLLAADPHAAAAVRDRAAAQARRYFLLALASERRALLPPAVVAVGGLIGTGKSTVARRLAGEMTAPVVEADRTRKQLLGVAPEQKVHVPPWQGPYSSEATAAVYGELLHRAGAVLRSGRPVVLDASFRSRARRAAARRLAAEHGVPFHFVECTAPPRLCRRRLEERQRAGGVSDGRLEIFDDFAAGWQNVRELPAEEHHVLDTAAPLEENIHRMRPHLPALPAALP